MARFDGTGSYLSNASPGLVDTGYPLTVGAWFNPTVNDKVIFGFNDTGAAAPAARLLVTINSAGQFSIASRTSAPPQVNGATSTAVTLGAWHFGVWRFINSTNRRVAGLYPSGLIEHGQDATANAPASLDAATIGCFAHSAGAISTSLWQGSIAEIWWTDTDIQPGGAQLDNTLLRQLAYGGPFSLPHVAQSLVEYHRLGQTIPGVLADAEDYGRSRFSWTNNGGVSLGSEPIVPVWHERPLNRSSLVMI